MCSEESFRNANAPGSLFAFADGGRAVYFGQEQTEVIRIITLGNFPPDLLIAGDTIPKYTTRPPKGPVNFCAGFVQVYGVKKGLVLAFRGGGVGRCTLAERGGSHQRRFSPELKTIFIPDVKDRSRFFSNHGVQPLLFPTMPGLTIQRIHISRRKKTIQNVYNNPGS
jgi:hypothetical protein